ncbi:hypothetical protein ACK386_05175 [Aeromonas veronii]
MMVDLKVMAYFKISLSTRNWDRAFFIACLIRGGWRVVIQPIDFKYLYLLIIPLSGFIFFNWVAREGQARVPPSGTTPLTDEVLFS